MARLMILDFPIHESIKVHAERRRPRNEPAKLTVIDRLAIIRADIVINFLSQFGYSKSSRSASTDTNAAVATVSVTVFT